MDGGRAVGDEVGRSEFNDTPHAARAEVMVDDY